MPDGTPLKDLYVRVKGEFSGLFCSEEKNLSICLSVCSSDAYGEYVKVVGGAIGKDSSSRLQQGNKLCIDDNTPLIHVLSDSKVSKCAVLQVSSSFPPSLTLLHHQVIGEGNDWLYLIITDIAAAHNVFVENLYAEVHSQHDHPLARLLPQEAANIYLTEASEHTAIIGSERRSVYLPS